MDLRSFCLCLSIVASLSLAAEQGDDEKVANLGRRLVAALRVPESATNVGDLIPTDDQLWERAMIIKSPYTVVPSWKIAGRRFDSRKNARDTFVDLLTRDLKYVRKFTSAHGIDVNLDSTLQSMVLNRGEYLVLRYADCDLIMATTKLDVDGRLYVCSISPASAVRAHGRSVSLTIWHSANKKDIEPSANCAMFDRCLFEFKAGLAGVDSATRDFGIRVFERFGEEAEVNKTILAQEIAPVMSSDDAVGLNLRGGLGAGWMAKVNGDVGRWKLMNLSCRRIDEEHLAFLSAQKRDLQEWQDSVPLDRSSRQAIDRLLSSFQNLLQKKDVALDEVQGLMGTDALKIIHQLPDKEKANVGTILFPPERRAELARGVVAAQQAEVQWRIRGDRARASVSVGDWVLQLECVNEQNEWKLHNFTLPGKLNK